MPKQSELLETLNKNFVVLFEKIDSLKDSLIKREEIGVFKDNNVPKEPEKVEPLTPSYPIPLEYRQLVDHVLNRNFNIKVEPMNDAPAFVFSIEVPDKYSNMTPSQKLMTKVDSRPKVISMAEGVNGVRQWAERVYKNFNPEIQAMIVADRL